MAHLCSRLVALLEINAEEDKQVEDLSPTDKSVHMATRPSAFSMATRGGGEDMGSHRLPDLLTLVLLVLPGASCALMCWCCLCVRVPSLFIVLGLYGSRA